MLPLLKQVIFFYEKKWYNLPPPINAKTNQSNESLYKKTTYLVWKTNEKREFES